MSRWHESGCRLPEVTPLDNLPCCNHCFAIAPDQSVPHNAIQPSIPPPTVQGRFRMNLRWPAVVHYDRNMSCGVLESADQTTRSSPSSTGGAGHTGDILKSQNEPIILPRIAVDQIRLVRVAAGQTGEPVHIHAEMACLTDHSRPSYDILSYIRADDFEDKRKGCPVFIGVYWDIIYVPPSFEEALRSIRHKQVDRTVWVDFLCINQEDVDEKTRQVTSMYEILTNASRTLIYPGRLSAEIATALDSIAFTASVSPTSAGRETGDRKSRTVLLSLFRQLYSKRVWAVQEVLLAKRLEIVCGQRSVPWTTNHYECVFNDAAATPFLIPGRGSWHESTGRDLLRLLVETSHYQCLDPRDKVFGILGLFRKEYFTADYQLPVECVYTGIAAYLVKNCRSLDIFAAISTAPKRREFTLPSWVPDWSCPVSLKFLGPGLSDSEREGDDDDDVDWGNNTVNMATPIVFEGVTDHPEPDITVDFDTGSLRIRAWKICAVAGCAIRVRGQTKVMINKGRRGVLVLSVFDETYRIGCDFVFLLCGWGRPIVLRHNPSTDSYSVVSVCAMALGPPLGGSTWLLPWKCPSLFQGTIRVSKFTSGENDLLSGFYSNLRILYETHLPPSIQRASAISSASATVEAMILDYNLLSLTGLGEVESRLKDTWDRLERQLGWMFLDQVALWDFLQEMNVVGTLEEGELSGEGTVPFGESEATMCEVYCGLQFPLTYRWDLHRFCQSFVRDPPVLRQSAAPEGGDRTPMLMQLKSHIPEIRKWAAVSEQLLVLFEYSGSVLRRSWTSFPGTELAEIWRSDWRRFRYDDDDYLQGASDSCFPGQQQLPPTPDGLWHWSEFKASLNLRGLLREQRMPPQLDPGVNVNMAARFALRSLGLDLGRQDRIQVN